MTEFSSDFQSVIDQSRAAEGARAAEELQRQAVFEHPPLRRVASTQLRDELRKDAAFVARSALDAGIVQDADHGVLLGRKTIGWFLDLKYASHGEGAGDIPLSYSAHIFSTILVPNGAIYKTLHQRTDFRNPPDDRTLKRMVRKSPLQRVDVGSDADMASRNDRPNIYRADLFRFASRFMNFS